MPFIEIAETLHTGHTTLKDSPDAADRRWDLLVNLWGSSLGPPEAYLLLQLKGAPTDEKAHEKREKISLEAQIFAGNRFLYA